jgi:hypothetical protein
VSAKISKSSYNKNPEGGGKEFLDSVTVVNKVGVFLEGFDIVGKGDENVFEFFFLGRSELFVDMTEGENAFHGGGGAFEDLGLSNERVTSFWISGSRAWAVW